jgi:hypothetical protein
MINTSICSRTLRFSYGSEPIHRSFQVVNGLLFGSQGKLKKTGLVTQSFFVASISYEPTTDQQSYFPKSSCGQEKVGIPYAGSQPTKALWLVYFKFRIHIILKLVLCCVLVKLYDVAVGCSYAKSLHNTYNPKSIRVIADSNETTLNIKGIQALT